MMDTTKTKQGNTRRKEKRRRKGAGRRKTTHTGEKSREEGARKKAGGKQRGISGGRRRQRHRGAQQEKGTWREERQGGRHLTGRKKCPGWRGRRATHHGALSSCSPASVQAGLPWPRPDLALACTVLATTGHYAPAMGTSPRPLARCVQESSTQPQQKKNQNQIKMAAATNHKRNKLKQPPDRKQQTPPNPRQTPPLAHTPQKPTHVLTQAQRALEVAESGQGTRDLLPAGDQHPHPGDLGTLPRE